MTEIDERYMRRCLELARLGGKAARPNPNVGSVVVRDGEIVGEGYHAVFGGPHAEVEALRAAGDAAMGATLYVTLEPCNHFGKTPPCSHAIREMGIARVVYGVNDPNPSVSGHGRKALENWGIKCESGVLEKECRLLSEVFFVNTVENRAFMVLKTAQTLDGYAAEPDGKSRWITGEESRAEAHRLRAEADGVLIGANTLRLDDPALTVRNTEGQNPRRYILTRSLDLPLEAQVFSESLRADTTVLAPYSALRESSEMQNCLDALHVRLLTYDDDAEVSLRAVPRVLFDDGVYSLLVEGGPGIHAALLEHDLIDRLEIFTAPIMIGRGIKTPAPFPALTLKDPKRFRMDAAVQRGDDLHCTYRRA